MSGVPEGILVDLGVPEEEENTDITENFLINTSGLPESVLVDLDVQEEERKESLEVFRNSSHDSCKKRKSSSLTSSVITDDIILQDITDTFNKSNHNTDSIIKNLDDETFDFDLPVTPVSSDERAVNTEDEAEEEVFFGPVGHRERCIAAVVSSITKEVKPLSPLNPRQFAEICKEANAVAARISSAAGSRINKTISKDQISCSKQLYMDKTPCIFSPAAVGKLLKAVNSRTDNTDNKENEMDVDDAGKQVCDMVRNSDSVTIDNVVDSRASKLPSLSNSPLLDISGVAEIALDEQKPGSSSEDEKPVEKIEESDVMTPSRRHTRSGTYTVSTVPRDTLPADKRKSLPVIDHSTGAKKEASSSSSAKKETNATNLTVKPSSAGKRSLDVPQKAESEKKSAPNIKRSNSKLVRPSKVTIPGTSVPVVKKTAKIPTPEENSAQTKPKSRLTAPKAALVGKESSLLPSKLKMPGPSTGATGIPSKTSIQPPQRSGIPGLKGKPAVNGSEKQAPVSKLQLMKPGSFQKSSLAASQNKAPAKKPGPLKALVPATTSKEDVEDMSTPAKEDKNIQPKNLMASKFTTPQKSGSTSSMDSPAMSRRSFLPTPNKSRTSSAGSIPSPCPGKNNSVFSNSSRGSSLSDSPGLNGSVNKPRLRQPSGSKSTGKFSHLDNLNDQSPNALKPKRQLVTNTPNLPRKKISPWSPVHKKKLDPDEQAIVCTKKMRK